MEEEAHLNQICQQLAERGEYEAILLISKTNTLAHEVCQQYVKPAIMNNSFPAKEHLEKWILDRPLEDNRSFDYLALHKILSLGRQYNLKVFQSLTDHGYVDRDDTKTLRKVLTKHLLEKHKLIDTLREDHVIAPVIATRYHQLIPPATFQKMEVSTSS